jgi:hypothetical protein
MIECVASTSTCNFHSKILLYQNLNQNYNILYSRYLIYNLYVCTYVFLLRQESFDIILVNNVLMYSCFEKNPSTSSGVVARDAAGNVLLTAWQVLRSASPEESGSRGMPEGVRLAVEWIRQPTIIESDCLTLIRAIEQRKESLSSWDGIIQEIRGVSSLLPQCKSRHEKQEANIAAHKLAQRALSTQECIVMRLDMPGEIRGIIEAEEAGGGNTDPCNSAIL